MRSIQIDWKSPVFYTHTHTPTHAHTHNTDKRKSNWMTCSFLCFPISFYCCTSQIIIKIDNKWNVCTHWMLQGDFCVFGVNRNTSQFEDEFKRNRRKENAQKSSISISNFLAISFTFFRFGFSRSEEKKCILSNFSNNIFYYHNLRVGCVVFGKYELFEIRSRFSSLINLHDWIDRLTFTCTSSANIDTISLQKMFATDAPTITHLLTFRHLDQWKCAFVAP